MAVRKIEIAGRSVSSEHPCFVIAEAGVNHNGSLEMARQLIDVAVEAGADAVKFQTFKAERLVTLDAPKARYQLANTGADESQLEMLKRLEISSDVHRQLARYCSERGIVFMSTPFDEKSADLLQQIGVPAFKIPSGEITNLPFLEHVAQLGKPVILSTGMAYLSEVESAVRTIEITGNHQLVLLHCTSNYPAAPEDANLRAMHTMASAFKVPVGYSDHTPGIEVSLAAIALGACVIEKHFTLNRYLPGPDHKASLEAKELSTLIGGIRIVEKSLGHGRKVPTDSEEDTARVARKSLVATQNIPAGTLLTEEMIAIKRPGFGLPPAMSPYLIGRTLKIPVTAGTLFTLKMIV